MSTQPVILASEFRTVTIPATAGDVVTHIVVPAGRRYKLLYGRLVLVCGIAVANRQQNIYLDDGAGNELTKLPSGAITTASQTKSFVIGPVSFNSGGVIVDDAFVGINETFKAPNPCIFQVRVVNGVAGDSYSGYLVFEVTPN